ncbi:TetR family transcriptional regulator (plasmid) [Embleya sp. NBC_00888]|uniref:TetR/AcrR family transcriptional regulator n=1 Tax=Embleya sp. NBC_00888 TaxID=2975960 RepID=UPI002F91792D|nr:TetR family transcriptional regulator [Embleya sp. NBC_00888]
MNQQRRDLLGDSAIEVLATTGMRGLTHRAVDDAAGLPPGTAKNYFRTRDALLLAAAERCAEHYRAAPRPMPTDRASLAAVLLVMLRNVVGPGRSRMLANLQLRSAYQAPLSAVLDDVAAADFAYFADALRHAGLPATPRHATALTLALHAAAPHLLGGNDQLLAAAGLDRLDDFVADLLDTVEGIPAEEASPARPRRR